MKKSIKAYLPLLAVLFLVSCSQTPEGEQVEAGDAVETETTAATDGMAFNVNAEDSKVHWLASKVTAQHPGTVKLSNGQFTVKDGNITAGSFVLDMSSIMVNDPNMDEESTGQLEGHLHSEDFFETTTYPTATFQIVSCEAAAGEAEITHRVTGNLTIKGITKSVNIPANVVVTESMAQIVSPQFTVDRSEWGITYPGAPDNLINDQIGIRLEMYAAPAEMQ
jgi:polyisoprenoid-binding protein YceI